MRYKNETRFLNYIICKTNDKALSKYESLNKLRSKSCRNICPICGREFKRKSALIIHINKGVCGRILLKIIRLAMDMSLDKNISASEFLDNKIEDYIKMYA